MRKVIVTGGRGFIGSAVAAELGRREFDVGAFDVPADVSNAEEVLGALDGAWGVIHLAGVLGTHELFERVPDAIRVNVQGTANVLEACRQHGTRYVGITMPQVFPSVYTATKIAATRLASAYHEAFGVPVSHVRAFNVFGPGQAWGNGHPQKLVPTASLAIWRGEPVPIWGDGEQTVDLIAVEDVARLLVDALAFGHDETFDGGTGHALSVKQAVGWLAQFADRPYTLRHLPMRRGERPTKIVAMGENWDKLSWRPVLRAEDIERTVLAYRDVA